MVRQNHRRTFLSSFPFSSSVSKTFIPNSIDGYIAGPIIEEISESEVEILSVSTTSSQEVNQNPSHPSGSEQVIPNTSVLSQTFDNFKQDPEMIR